MKIPIHISKLTDSPYCKDLKDSFLLEDDEVVNQIVQELNNAKPSSFLVSGYRGVGKTSFVNRVYENLDNSVTVQVSLAKYDGYKTLLKKVIRQLYLSFQSIETIEGEKAESLKTRFSLLYDRTFNEITNVNRENNQVQNSATKSTEFDLKKLGPILLVLFTGSNAIFSLTEYPVVNYIVFLISIVWATLTSWKLSFKKEKIEQESQEILRKTLYDDEIAESKLFEILSELKELKIKVVITFDELDKIKAVKTVEEIINDLKSLLLSGYSNFFVISGQGLYYQLEKSRLADDPVISSLFSKAIHVPLFRHSSLKKFCLNLVDDEDLKKDQILNNFIDSLILEASGIPRRVSNLIRDKLSWENNKAFIMLDESQNDYYLIDSRLLSVIVKISDGDLRKITSNIVKQDFFTSQIYLWVGRIKNLKSNKFKIDEIVNIKLYNLDDYPEDYLAQLESLCELFFDRLIEDKVLKKDLGANKRDYYYSWVSNEELEGVGIIKPETQNNVSSDLILGFTDLEEYLRGIYIDLNDGVTVSSPKLSLKQMLNNLIQLGVIDKNWSDSNKIDSLIDVRNKIVHGVSIDDLDTKALESFRFDVSRLKAELIEDYTFFVTKKHLVNYIVLKENKGGFDFVANKENNSIAFEVKYLIHGRPDTRNIFEIINKFTNYIQSTTSDSHYVLFFYQPNGRKSYDEFYSKFFDIVNNTTPELANRFHLFYTSEYRGDASSGRIQVYLDKVLESIKNTYWTKPMTAEEVFPGKWRMTFKWEGIDKTEEFFEIKNGNQYFIGNHHACNIESLVVNYDRGELSFKKVGIGDDKRILNNILKIISTDKFEGTEGNETEVSYTKL